MPDILLKRQTRILVADNDALFPRNNLYPADDLYPIGAGVREVSNIVAGSLKLDALIAENKIQLGQFYATKFEVQVYNEEDLSDKYIHVYQVNNGLYSDIFSGKVDSCKLDKVGTDRTVVAYDLAYQVRQMNVADFWNSYWTNRETSTLGHIRNAVLDYYGIEHEVVTLLNDDFVIKKNVEFTSCSFQQLTQSICELNCCLPHFDRNGFMTFIVLNTESTPIDLTGKYEWTNSDFEDFVTEPVSGVQFFDSSDQLKYTIGNAENAYPIKKNIFLYDADTATLESVGNAIFEYLQELIYTPASLKMIEGSFGLHLGDYVHTDKGNFYILQNSYSGSQFVEQTIKAKGAQKNYEGTPTLDYGEIVLNERIAKVAYDLEGFEVAFGDYKTEVSHEFDTIFSNYEGEYVPTTSNSPADTWTTDTVKAQHLNEVFFDSVHRLYYRWVLENGTYKWKQLTVSAYRYDIVSSNLRITDEMITTEVKRATQKEGDLASDLSTEQERAKLAEKLMFSNYNGKYVPTASNAPANTWTTPALKQEHLKEVFCDTSSNKYYRWSYENSVYQWIEIPITTSSYQVAQSAIKQTADELTINMNKSFELSVANYNGTYIPTTSNAPANTWTTTDLKNAHLGEVFYDSRESEKKYYRWVLDGSTFKWEWIKTPNGIYDVTTSNLKFTSEELMVEINTEKTAREQADLAATYNYTGTTAPTNPWTDADRNHVGEIYYRSDTQQYYVFEHTGTNIYEWVQTTPSRIFDLTTISNTAKFNMAEDEILLEVSESEKRLFANYTGSVVPTNSNYPASSWTTTTQKKAHRYEVYYDTVEGKYYRWEPGYIEPNALRIKISFQTDIDDFLDIAINDTVDGDNVYGVYRLASANRSTKTFYTKIPENDIVEFAWHAGSNSNRRYGFKLEIERIYATFSPTQYDYTTELWIVEDDKVTSYQSESAHPYQSGNIYFDRAVDEFSYDEQGNYAWVEVATDDIPFDTVTSQIKQTAEEISLKVDRNNVVSEINLSTDAIRLTTAGRLVITAGNFKVDELGNITAANATLTGASINGGSLEMTNDTKKLRISNAIINFYENDILCGRIASEYSEQYSQEFLSLESNSQVQIVSEGDTVISSKALKKGVRVTPNGVVKITTTSGYNSIEAGNAVLMKSGATVQGTLLIDGGIDIDWNGTTEHGKNVTLVVGNKNIVVRHGIITDVY